MNKTIKIGLVSIGLWAVCVIPNWAQGPSQLTEPPRLVFKYELGQQLVYASTAKAKINLDIKLGSMKQDLKADFIISYHVKLTPLKVSDAGITTMRLETSDISGDWDIKGPTGHIILALRGSEMTGTQDGTTIIDTAQGIGVVRAQSIMKEVNALYLSGEVDLNSSGDVLQFRGDPAFVDFWTKTLKSAVGMWGVVFPDRPLAVNDSWTEQVWLDKLGEVRLAGEGLRLDVIFTRQPDKIKQDRRLVVLKLNAPINQKDLVGYMNQGGTDIGLEISKLSRQATGVLYFDPQLGLLTEATTIIDGNGLMSSRIQGETVNIDMQLHVEDELRLLAPGP